MNYMKTTVSDNFPRTRNVDFAVYTIWRSGILVTGLGIRTSGACLSIHTTWSHAQYVVAASDLAAVNIDKGMMPYSSVYINVTFSA